MTDISDNKLRKTKSESNLLDRLQSTTITQTNSNKPWNEQIFHRARVTCAQLVPRIIHLKFLKEELEYLQTLQGRLPHTRHIKLCNLQLLNKYYSSYIKYYDKKTEELIQKIEDNEKNIRDQIIKASKTLDGSSLKLDGSSLKSRQALQDQLSLTNRLTKSALNLARNNLNKNRQEIKKQDVSI